MASQINPEQHAEPTPIRRPRADQARLVADVLRHQIHAGGYPDGLPGEQDLAANSSSPATPSVRRSRRSRTRASSTAAPRSAPTSPSASTTTASTRSSA